MANLVHPWNYAMDDENELFYDYVDEELPEAPTDPLQIADILAKLINLARSTCEDLRIAKTQFPIGRMMILLTKYIGIINTLLFDSTSIQLETQYQIAIISLAKIMIRDQTNSPSYPTLLYFGCSVHSEYESLMIRYIRTSSVSDIHPDNIEYSASHIRTLTTPMLYNLSVPQPSTKTQLRELSVIHKPVSEEHPANYDCPICYDTHDTNDIIFTNCKHGYCFQCITLHANAIKDNSDPPSCPCCRTTIKEISSASEPLCKSFDEFISNL
jgi:hypothetical protein